MHFCLNPFAVMEKLHDISSSASSPKLCSVCWIIHVDWKAYLPTWLELSISRMKHSIQSFLCSGKIYYSCCIEFLHICEMLQYQLPVLRSNNNFICNAMYHSTCQQNHFFWCLWYLFLFVLKIVSTLSVLQVRNEFSVYDLCSY